MQADDRIGEAFHEPGIQPMALGQSIEQRFLVEAHHLDEPVDRLARARPAPARHRFARDRTTPRYREGAVRRFSRTSASHATRLSSTVEKST